MQKYFRHKIEKLLVIDKIVTLHYFEFDKNFAGRGESHDFWELVYADRMSVVCTAGEKTVTLGEGEVLFHKPNEYHSLAANGVKAPNVFIISFECKSEAIRFFEGKKLKLGAALKKYIYAMLDVGRRTFDIPFSSPETKKMELSPHPALGGMQLIKNYLEIMLITLMQNADSGREDVFLHDEEMGGKLAADIVSILTQNVCGRLTVDEICDRINYSRAYVFRAFKAATGTSIMDYYTRLKIDRAKKLLRETDCTVKEISDSLCFDTPNYFCKTFKRITAQTPLTYKKRATLGSSQ